MGNWLYIDGGEIWTTTWSSSEYSHSLASTLVAFLCSDRLRFVPPSRKRLGLTLPHLAIDSQTFAIDLSKSWDPSSVSVVVNAKPASLIPGRSPNLYYDVINNIVYAWGGWPYSLNQVSVWGFTPTSDGTVTWVEKFTQDDGSSFNTFTRSFGGLTASSRKAFYCLGGYIASESDPRFALDAQYAITGQASFDFASSKWSNASVDEQLRLSGRGEFVPLFGEEGVLIYVGGDQPTVQKYVMGSAMVPMNTITVYDIKSKTYHQQTTSGDLPVSRNYFCSVGVGAAGNSTWEM